MEVLRLEMEDPVSIGFKKQIIFEKITQSVFAANFFSSFELGSSHKNETSHKNEKMKDNRKP
jgi:hypothetical protein